MANPGHVELVLRGADATGEFHRNNRSIVLDLREADLRDAKLRGADLRRADLRRADLRGADLRGADLSEADLRQANLYLASLMGANLTWANLSGTDLSGVYLDFTRFQNALVVGADFSDSLFNLTIVSDVDLREAKGLDKARHIGPSTIGIDTLYKSAGQIPDVFLRACGVPENLITYLHSLTGKAFDFYSCFISYSEKDNAFSEQLYNDLQSGGVRCWRWRNNAKWGSTLMKEVDTAIRLYDKLVVILSEHSLKSEPVIREIERALQKEARDKKEVLFPIRIDSAIYSWQHELQLDVVRKVMGDFREWKDPEEYKQSLKRLIDSLQAPTRTVA